MSINENGAGPELPPLESAALAVLEGLYACHGERAQARSTACGPGCAVCCTDRVLLTGLEGLLLLKGLLDAGREDLLEAAVAAPVDAAVRPRTTFNALARLCLAREEDPTGSEEAAAEPGACPLLRDGLCAAYAQRPLACRAMASLRKCQRGGQAEDDPFWLSLNPVFFQLVEQCSLAGDLAFFGLLPDVLTALVRGRQAASGLLACEPLPGLVTPPQDQARIQEALRPVFGRLVAGRPLGWWLDEFRRQAGR